MKVSRKELESCEVNCTLHCNLRCAWCDHSSPHVGQWFLKVDDLEKDLAALSKFTTMNDIRLVGGEPLLHPEIVAIARAAKKSGAVKKVTLITNGVLLHRAPEDIWQYIDRLWVSRYPNVRTSMDDQAIRTLAASHSMKVSIVNQPYFRIKTLSRPNSSPDWIQTIYNACDQRRTCRTIKDGYFFTCPPAALFPERMPDVNRSDYQQSNGVRLDGTLESARAIHNYLNRKEPLPACAWCLGTIGKVEACRQLTKDEVVTTEQETLQWLVDVKHFPLITGSFTDVKKALREWIRQEVRKIRRRGAV